jgi:hypothetical protein
MSTELQLLDSPPRKPMGRSANPAWKRAKGRRQKRHGLAALRVTLFDESEQEFLEFHQGLVDALSPRDMIEDLLVERLATSAWRLRRIYRIESGLFSKARVSAHNGKFKRTRDIELVFLRLTAEEDLAKLTAYEAGLEHAMYQAIRRLSNR